MSPFENREFNGHELVTFGNDGPTALRAIVAVHSTALGPRPAVAACGPTNPDEAITDALRLSRGMSYKNAMAGLPFGGGKAVIIGDSRARRPRCSKRSAVSSIRSVAATSPPKTWAPPRQTWKASRSRRASSPACIVAPVSSVATRRRRPRSACSSASRPR